MKYAVPDLLRRVNGIFVLELTGNDIRNHATAIWNKLERAELPLEYAIDPEVTLHFTRSGENIQVRAAAKSNYDDGDKERMRRFHGDGSHAHYHRNHY